MNPTVYFDSGTVYCAAGNRIETVWQHLADGQRNLSALPCPAFDNWPWPQVFTVEEPTPGMMNIDRKLLRTMEKQAKLALYGATLAMKDAPNLIGEDKSRTGLYLGLPTIDEPVPPWSALQSLHEGGDQGSLSEVFHREIPPFFGLSQLNSSACAHIAGTFGMTGAMGAYSPFADAGLQAIIEAALSIINGENDAALAGGISAKINPLLLLQYEHFGWTQETARVPGEGAAYVILNTVGNAARRIRLSGYSRGFADNALQPETVQTKILQRALAMAEITAADLDWILPGVLSATEHSALQALCGSTELPLACSAEVCGSMGPASPVLNLLLALHGMHHQKRLRHNKPGVAHTEEQLLLRHALVTATGPEGQYVAVILSAELT